MTLGERKPLSSESDLRHLAAQQYGVFSHAQASEGGISPAGITRRVKSGTWERVLPKVYRVVGVPASDLQRAMAATLWAGDGAVVSHGSAGQLWSIPGARARARATELWVPVPRAPRAASIVVHRGTRIDRADRTRFEGVPVTTALRTLIDLSARFEDDRLLNAMEDLFRRKLVTPERLAVRLDALAKSGRPGAGRLRRLFAERDVAPSESVLEAKVWLLLSRSPLPRPVRQHWVDTPAGRYRFDFAWPAAHVALECDGWEHHGGRAAFGKDRARLSEVASSGWRTLIATWEIVTRDPRRVLRWVDSSLANAAT
jgi:very-short-patch-repair endonuclease